MDLFAKIQSIPGWMWTWPQTGRMKVSESQTSKMALLCSVVYYSWVSFTHYPALQAWNCLVTGSQLQLMERLEMVFFKFTVADGTFMLLSASGSLMHLFFFTLFINKFIIFYYSFYRLIYLFIEWLLCPSMWQDLWWPLSNLVCTEIGLDICD